MSTSRVGKTVYQANYRPPSSLPAETGKRRDQLKSGQLWTGGSTYRQLFVDPKTSSKGKGNSKGMTSAPKVSQSLSSRFQQITSQIPDSLSSLPTPVPEPQQSL